MKRVQFRTPEGKEVLIARAYVVALIAHAESTSIHLYGGHTIPVDENLDTVAEVLEWKEGVKG